MRWGTLAWLLLALGCGGASANAGEDEGNSGTGESGEGTGESGSSSDGTTDTGTIEPDLPPADLPAPDCGGDGVPEPGEVCFEHVDLIEDAWFSGLVAVADLNDDGNADVLQAVEIPCPDQQIDAPWPGKGPQPVEGWVMSSLRWYPGNGDGTLGDFTQVEAPASIVAMHVSQFNGYAFSDLAVVMGGLPSSAVVVEGNGQGTLPDPLSASDSVLADDVFRAAFGFLGGDGWTDLVVSTASGPAKIYRDDGNGVFVDPVDVPLPDPLLLPAVADFDGDGAADLAVVRHHWNDDADRRVHVYWNVPLNGVGAHWQSDVIPGPEAVAAADLDGDGDAELLLADPEAEQLHALPGAMGALEDPITLDLGPIRALAVGRFDGDEHLDVAAFEAWAPQPTLHVVLGDVGSVLGEVVEIAEENEHGDPLAAGDLNGDGVDDLVFGDMHALMSNP